MIEVVSDSRFIRWFWSAVGIWSAVLVMVLPGAALTTWVAYAAVVPVLGALFAFDMVARRLPLALSHLALGLFVLLVSFGSVVHGDGRVVGVVVGAFTFAVIGVVLGSRRELFGRGDVHLCPLLGAMAGWFDPRATVTVLLVATTAGALCGLLVVLGGRGRRGTLIPYGPFLMFGTMVTMIMSANNI